jgi:hypothetical protein
MKKLILFLLLISSPLMAADIAVCPAPGAGSTDGSNWSNCTSGLPATLTRGDTYYLADGSYGAVTLDDALSSTLWIYIKKATASAHGPATGWDNGLGDGTATFSKISIRTEHLVEGGRFEIDGVTQYGIKVESTGTADLIDTANYYGPVNNLVFRNLEVTLNSLLNANNGSGFYLLADSDSVTIEDCWIHDLGYPIFLGIITNSTIQDNIIGPHNAVADQRGGSGHGQTIQITTRATNLTIRRNKFVDCEGQAIVTQLGYEQTSDGLYFYNNLIYYTGVALTYSSGTLPWGFAGTGGLISCLDPAICTDWYVYENTISNVTGSNVGGYAYTEESTIFAKNNLFFSNIAAPAPANWTLVTTDTNWYSTGTYAITTDDATNKKGAASNPFTDSATFDFTLAAASNPMDIGLTLGTPYNTDFLGAARVIGTYDIGAYERGGIVGGGTYPVIKIGTGAVMTLGTGAAFKIE